jgi:hypothetical protein
VLKEQKNLCKKKKSEITVSKKNTSVPNKIVKNKIKFEKFKNKKKKKNQIKLFIKTI